MNFHKTSTLLIIFLASIVGNKSGKIISTHEGDSVANDEEAAVSVDYRLPRTVYPTAYEIKLLPRLEGDFSFRGIVKINATVKYSTRSIVLHAGDVNIETASVITNGSKLALASLAHNNTTEKYTIDLKEILEEGSNILMAISYTGKLSDNNIGFYRSSYFDAEGNLKWLAATQFQTTHARHAFPCFDEPHFKATFVVSIQRHKKFKCLSNMPLEKSEPVGTDMYWDTFQESVPMSTYLVAFVVSEFDKLQDGSFSVWARADAIRQAEYALQIGPRALKYLTGIFGQKYTLPKMDMVAVPDFAAGAMENWGLITYRETRMLYDDDECSVKALQDVASVIVHECTHMWFGNLVTPAWWSFLWLSEAFARYFQYFATAQLEPSWSMDQQFLVEQHQIAFAVDGLESSKPMTREVQSQSQIGGIGDQITYSKGASIVRMMSLIFGHDVFSKGLQVYLENNKERGTTSPEYLWKALQDIVDSTGSDIYVQTAMDTWTTQSGFPVVSVSISDNGKIELRQNRFLLRSASSSVASNTTWWVPITWASRSKPDFDVSQPYWLNEQYGETKIDIRPGDWVILNVQEAGFYRVNYDRASWYRIIDVLNSNEFEVVHVLNRAAIVDDLLNLARAGLLDYQIALDGLQYIKRETNYLPFKAAFNGLEYLNRRFLGQDHESLYTKYVLSLIEPIYRKVGYTDRQNDDRLTILLRRELNTLACNLGHEGCIAAAIREFGAWRRNPSLKVNKNHRPAVYATAIKHGNADDWEFLWEQYLKTGSSTEQTVILGALGCSSTADILEKYLGYAISGYEKSRIRKQDSAAAFSSVYSCSLFGAKYILDFVGRRHHEMSNYYGGLDTVASILSGASQRFSSRKLVSEFESFLNSHAEEFRPVEKSLESSLKLAKYELEWYERNADSVASWIQGHDGTVTPVPSLPPTNEDDIANDSTNYRLSTSVVPRLYDISVEPFMKVGNFTFSGFVRITADVITDTDTIDLHSVDIIHDTVKVTVNGETIEGEITDIPKYSFLRIKLNQALKSGSEVTIEISYTGILNAEMRGFYRSSYVDNYNNTRWLAATHLEPVGARKMFPCFDEPALKAVFLVNAIVPRGYNAISNMPMQRVIAVTNSRRRVEFAETPKMSTYLLALIVSDFESLTDDSYRFSVWARPSASHQTKFALSVMAPLIRFFEESLEHKYQLPKLDMVALPDFASGAMENWGLLTYKESNMIYDKNETSVSVKQAVANVISHEISHQWFGNLVSPSWWKYLWLNEGFARYFQYFGTSNVKTSWSLESQFVVEQLHSAFATDGLTSSHPMSHDVYTPTEISGIFDAISYAKSASVLRMMEKVLGRKVFYASLHNYLEARKYDAATPADLYKAFQEQVANTELNDSISTIMDSWTTQAGFPVVHVSIRKNSIRLTQERFLIRNHVNAPTNSTWYVPITWASESNPDFENTKPKYWLTQAEGEIEISSSNDQWYIFNVQQAGYYRVNYDVDNWHRIIKLLKSDEFKTIHVLNRAMLVDDAMNLARAGYLDYNVTLSLTEYLKQETDYMPWRAFFNGLTYLYRRFVGTGIYGRFLGEALKTGHLNNSLVFGDRRKCPGPNLFGIEDTKIDQIGQEAMKTHLKAILPPIYYELTFSDKPTDDHATQLLRMHVRDWTCKLHISDCRYRSVQYHHDWEAGAVSSVPPNYRSTVYCVIVNEMVDEVWESKWQRYLNSSVAADKLVILKALGCTSHSNSAYRLMQRAITKDSGIRYQDSLTAFTAVYDGSTMGDTFVNFFIRKHLEEMYDYYGDESKIKSILSGLGQRIATQSSYDEYIATLDIVASKLPSLAKSLKSYATNAYNELKWYRKSTPKMLEWLEKTYPTTGYRLPKTAKPWRYNISIIPYLEDSKFIFDGTVQMDLALIENTTVLVLNARELMINSIQLYETNAKNATPYSYLDYKLDATTETLTIFLENYADSPNITVEIEYSGLMNDEMKGFYRSSYTDRQGNVHWIGTTQFQPTHARRAFPCLDEPGFKANFIINIRRPNNYIALSNMPLKSSRPATDTRYTWDSFDESPPMSSYLVAFIVSDFASASLANSTFKVYGRPDVVNYGEDTLRRAALMLKYLENFTGIPYALPKMDLVGIPDFSAGAMENWGLVTFREYGVFADKDSTPARYVKYISTVVAHEFVHMWHGNLATCEWWEYIWLNEGFAEYLEWLAADAGHPEYELLKQFTVYELQPAMDADASESSHPINHPVSTPSEIQAAFDKITYSKGASFLRMLHHSLGSDAAFRSVVRQYLKGSKFDTVNPQHLWNAVEAYTKSHNGFEAWNQTLKNVETLMSSWTNQTGYPIVQANRSSSNIRLTQVRFVMDDRTVSIGYVYWTPITIASSRNPEFENPVVKLWLGGEPANVPIDQSDDWYIVNVQQQGYYRVNYDIQNWWRLRDVLNEGDFTAIHELNRAQIVNDVLNLARANYLPYDVALSVTRYLRREQSHVPWRAFFNAVSFLAARYVGQPGQPLLRRHILSLTDNVYAKLGFEENKNDSPLNELNRELILTWRCKLDDEDCIKNSTDRFAAWRSNSSKPIPRNARPAVYCTAIKHGNHDDWMFLKNQYLTTNFASEAIIILNALGCSRNETTLYSYLAEAFPANRSSIFRPQDASTILSAVYSAHPEGLNAALDFLMSNYEQLSKYYKNWADVGSAFSGLANYISTQEQIDKLKSFVDQETTQLLPILSTLDSSLTKAEENLGWFKRHYQTLDKWIAELYSKPDENHVSAAPSTSAFSLTIVCIISIVPYMLSLF